jgi:hypothetical protein
MSWTFRNGELPGSCKEYRFYMWSLVLVLGGAGVMQSVVVLEMQMAVIGVCGA